MKAEEAKKLFAEHDVKFVLAQFVDIHGSAKTKAVPVDHFDDILGAGAGFAGFAVWGLGIEPHGPDFMAVGDLNTVSLVPWQPGYARIACDGHVTGKPWEYDTRVVLKQQVQRLK
ncbi:MAG: type III glutamate--ammonia ligase, partial [Candidatus Competibacteraceae bacterium]